MRARKARRSCAKRVVIFSCMILNQYSTSSSLTSSATTTAGPETPRSEAEAASARFFFKVGSLDGSKPPGPLRAGGGRLV